MAAAPAQPAPDPDPGPAAALVAAAGPCMWAANGAKPAITRSPAFSISIAWERRSSIPRSASEYMPRLGTGRQTGMHRGRQSETDMHADRHTTEQAVRRAGTHAGPSQVHVCVPCPRAETSPGPDPRTWLCACPMARPSPNGLGVPGVPGEGPVGGVSPTAPRRPPRGGVSNCSCSADRGRAAFT